MRKFGITFWFYAKEHFKTKSLIMYAIFTAATVGIIFAIGHFGGGGYTDIAIVQESNTFVIDEGLFDLFEGRNFYFVNSEDEARAMLDDDEVSNVFIISGDERPEMTMLTSDLSSDFEVEMFITQMLTAQHLETMMIEHDLPAEVVLDLTAPMIIDSEFADFEDLIAVELVNSIVPIAIMLLVIMSGQMVANSVASEKTSRVMEVMLGKVHPTITMMAKILSSLLGILLPMIAILVGVVIAQILDFIELDMLVDLVSQFISIEALILTIVVFILGYFCFIFLFAAAGAIANSIESLASTLTPATYLTMLPYFAAILLPIGGPIVNILVYVPFVTPFVIVQRFILGYSNVFEIGVSLVGMALFSVLMLIISARLYMNGISHTSEKVTLSDYRKMLRK